MQKEVYNNENSIQMIDKNMNHEDITTYIFTSDNNCFESLYDFLKSKLRKLV